MTLDQRIKAWLLERCRILPGKWHRTVVVPFVRSICEIANRYPDKELSEKETATLLRLYHMYRMQIAAVIRWPVWVERNMTVLMNDENVRTKIHELGILVKAEAERWIAHGWYCDGPMLFETINDKNRTFEYRYCWELGDKRLIEEIEPREELTLDALRGLLGDCPGDDGGVRFTQEGGFILRPSVN